MLIYGEPRLTQDIDITLGIDSRDFQKLSRMAAQLSLIILVENPEHFVKQCMVLPTRDKKTGIRVEFIFSNSLYEKQAMERVKKIKIGSTVVSFASLEDLVIHKLIAGRPRDIEDIKGILLRNAKYDKSYVRKWLLEFDKSLEQGYSALLVEIKRDLKR